MRKTLLVVIAALFLAFPVMAQEGVGASASRKPHIILFSASLATAEADAASTVRAQNVLGFSEGDPLARPFLEAPRPVYFGSEAAMSFGLERLGEQMQRSRRWHRIWWLPQVVQIGFSAYCAANNSRGIASR